MNKFRIKYPSLLPQAFLSISVSLAFATSIAAEESIDSTDELTTLEHVKVVGEKTERSLKDTSSSVVVFSEEELNSLQNYTVSNVIAEVPNIVVTSGAVPNIRGVNGNGSAGGFNSITGGAKARVSTLIDGITEPFVADLTGDSGIWDIEQLEVYRGPQSTSSGRNSIGGMVYIKTKDPSFDWEAAARLGYRNQDRYLDGAFMVSGPIVDDVLAFRLSAEQLNAQTNSDDEGYETNPADYDINEIKTNRLKAKLLWELTEDFSAMLSYSGSDEKGDTGRLYYSAENPDAYQRIYFREIDTNSDTVSLRLNYSLSDSVSFNVLAAHMDYQWGFDAYEADPAEEQQLVFDETNTMLDAKMVFGQEASSISGFVGLAYFERKQDFESTGPYAYIGDDKSDSTSIYGEFTYSLHDRLDFTAGIRVEKEQQERDFNYITFDLASDLETDKTVILPKFAVLYHIDDNTTVGVSARQGYNAAGGAFAFATSSYYYFDEETVDTYEASVRSSLDDGNIQLSANVFYNDYDDYQALNSNRQIINMDKVTTYGVELQGRLLLSEAVEISGGLGLLETNIDDPGTAFEDAKNNELSTAPSVTGNLGINYYFSDGFNIGVSARYVDEYYGDIENNDSRIAGDYTLARLSANYNSDTWSVSAYLNNALDDDAFTVREPPGRSAPLGYVSRVDPQTFGLTITYKLF